MPDPALAAAIATLSGGRLRELNNLHDDYDHTRKLWKMLRIEVRRYGKRVTFQNENTGTRVDGAQLAGRTGAVLRRLNEQSFKEMLALFELFLSDLLRLWLTAHVPLVEGKAGPAARARIGDALDISDDYHTVAFELVRRIINDLSNAAGAAT
jgi:hypothetical protein